jgi:hypothetical protein
MSAFALREKQEVGSRLLNKSCVKGSNLESRRPELRLLVLAFWERALGIGEDFRVSSISGVCRSGSDTPGSSGMRHSSRDSWEDRDEPWYRVPSAVGFTTWVRMAEHQIANQITSR